MTDLICVDAAAQEDLMVLDQLARTVLRRQSAGVRQMVIQGSGETHERKLETRGLDVTRRDGALLSQDPQLELVFRETNRSWANRLTDEGLYATALMGTDRGFLRVADDQVVPSTRLAASAWPAPAVVPVLAAVALDPDGSPRDVHPIRVASALARSLEDAVHIVVITRRAVPKNDAVATLSRQGIIQNGWLNPETPIPAAGEPWILADLVGWASGHGVEVL
ncbi:MAG: hypothetical protein O3C45_09490 [Bacteroidetes bacterium]|nr:hypothetical protein [Bacteroidota bacterium]MDA0875275.1 hypothetical protein [Bacteroidota bacterium]